MRDDLRAMLRRVGVPALFVTHDQEDAFAIADRIALLKKGKLLQSGTPEELYDFPASREVAAFIGRGSIVAADDKGTTAAVTIGGVTRDVSVMRPKGSKSRLEKAFVVMRPDMLENWWTDEIAAHLQQFYRDLKAGRRPKLALMTGPQHGKSWTVTDFAAWVATCWLRMICS